jgi:hypothetical protein
MAQAGYRTLCVAEKVLAEPGYAKWADEYAAACVALTVCIRLRVCVCCVCGARHARVEGGGTRVSGPAAQEVVGAASGGVWAATCPLRVCICVAV